MPGVSLEGSSPGGIRSAVEFFHFSINPFANAVNDTLPLYWLP